MNQSKLEEEFLRNFYVQENTGKLNGFEYGYDLLWISAQNEKVPQDSDVSARAFPFLLIDEKCPKV